MRRVVLLLMLALPACSRDPSAEGQRSDRAGTRAFPVEVLPVPARNLEYAIDAVGSLEADEEVLIVARVPGVVEAVAFQEGDAVTPESVLVTIDPIRYGLAVERARASHARAEAERREAEAGYARRKALREKDAGFVSEEELTNHEALVAKAKAAEAEAKAELDLAEQDLRESQVRPAKAGTINEKLVRTGQYVERGAPLARLVDTRRLRLRFRVTESESARLGASPGIRFQVRPFPGRSFDAALYHLSRQADAATRMVDGLAWVDNRDGLLRPGFFAEVKLQVGTREAAPVVPEGAILPTERGLVAFVVEDGVARERHPSLGLHAPDGAIEVIDGLKAGESLVVRGAHVLKDGAKVEIVKPKDGGPKAPTPPPTGDPAPNPAK